MKILKWISAAITALLLAHPLSAQISNPQIILVSGAPSGACTQNLPDEQVITLGTIYTCQSGTWTLATGSGGGTFNALTGDATSTSTVLYRCYPANTWTAVP